MDVKNQLSLVAAGYVYCKLKVTRGRLRIGSGSTWWLGFFKHFFGGIFTLNLGENGIQFDYIYILCIYIYMFFSMFFFKVGGGSRFKHHPRDGSIC